MKFLKRRLNRELNAIVPPWQGGTSAEERQTEKKIGQRLPFRFKGIISAACVSMAAVCAVVFTLLLLPAAPSGYAYVTLEINPEVAFVTQDNTVVRAVSLNSDADVVLSGDFSQELVGKPVEESATVFVDRAAQLGYLDLNGYAAVRISAEGGTLLQTVGESLNGYFMEQGAYVAVASRELTSGQIAQWVGGTGDGLQILLETAESFAERQTAGLSVGELTENYRKNVVDGQLKSYLYSSLKAGLSDLEKCIRLLDELTVLNEMIKEHVGNPVKILLAKDYFTVKAIYPDRETYSSDFKKLMAQADGIYEAYLSLGLSPIASEAELEGKKVYLNTIPVDTLYWLLENFDGYQEFIENIYQVLDFFGQEVNRIEQLISGIPQTAEEYLAYTADAVAMQADALAERYLSAYGTERKSLSSEEYRSFTEGIASYYGSLNDYFEKLKVKD